MEDQLFQTYNILDHSFPKILKVSFYLVTVEAKGSFQMEVLTIVMQKIKKIIYGFLR